MVLLAGTVAAGWWMWRRPAPSILQSRACRGCNLLLITVDTLRSDRVEAFGGAAGLTPALDRLAVDGVRFTRTYSPAPLTLPAHASIMTAASPPVHGVRANGLFRLGAAPPTLASVLQSAGYRTGAFVGAFVLDARFGLNRGFEIYDDRYDEGNATTDSAERRGEDVINPATDWILARGSTRSTGSGQASSPPADRGNARPEPVDPSAVASAKAEGRAQPWFAWVHLYDPHDPYRAPEPYASRHAPYDAEVAYADAMVGKLISDLQSAGQLDRTVVMVSADHGESLGEHGEPTHGVFAYDVTQRVPWIVWAGSHIGRGASDALVRLIDLAPTALDLLGVDPPREFEGRSVVPVVEGSESTPRVAYLEAMDANLTRNWAPLTAVASGGYKLIDLPMLELYDVDQDPREMTNLVRSEPDRMRDLKVLLNDTTRTLARQASGGERAMLGAEATRRLQALGYVASSAGAAPGTYGPADDPKTLIPVAGELNRAIERFDQGDRSGAIGSVTAIVQSHPRFSTAYTELARMQRASGNLRAAIETLETAARHGIAHQRMMTVLAGYFAESQQLEKATTILQAVVAEHPDDVEALNSLGVVASRRGDHDVARTTLKKVVDLDPTSARAYANLAADALATGKLDEAVPDLRRAIELDRHAYDALLNLGMALWELGRRDEAAPVLERFAREAPPQYAQDVARVRTLLRK
jgi:arylsulfatase A-like enzyme/Flp pilus assembly protein TadD